MNNKIAAVILGAGKGTRMNSDLPKVMMKVKDVSMIKRIINTLENLKVDEIITVISKEGDVVKQEVAPYKTCVQEEQLGTGHAVNSAKDLLKNFDGTVLVIFGDTPLIGSETFLRCAQKVREGFAVVVLGFETENPARYGRLIMEGDELLKIVEYKDATEFERAIRFCNSGCMAFRGKYLFEILSKIGHENAAGEYYLTDAVEVARKMGLRCTAIQGDEHEIASANTREELALLEKYLEEKEKKC
ncbi:MAG: NTP transferase domain-containing protein [Alphaproteobacteria bacterium]|nr:NTP transferase domain-containing protein [Alphaproteobacteria bacterium]